MFKRFNDASAAAAKILKDSPQERKAWTKQLSSDNDSDSSPNFVDTLLDIGAETALLAESKDIRDELNMISMVLQHQVAV